MTSQHFDTLTRIVATASSRRDALKAVAGGALAGLTGAVINSRDASAAEPHLCCVYRCGTPPDIRFKHHCIKTEVPPPGQVPICPQVKGCTLAKQPELVTKCAECGELVG